jgi:hypothetical protein
MLALVAAAIEEAVLHGRKAEFLEGLTGGAIGPAAAATGRQEGVRANTIIAVDSIAVPTAEWSMLSRLMLFWRLSERTLTVAGSCGTDVRGRQSD